MESVALGRAWRKCFCLICLIASGHLCKAILVGEVFDPIELFGKGEAHRVRVEVLSDEYCGNQ